MCFLRFLDTLGDDLCGSQKIHWAYCSLWSKLYNFHAEMIPLPSSMAASSSQHPLRERPEAQDEGMQITVVILQETVVLARLFNKQSKKLRVYIYTHLSHQNQWAMASYGIYSYHVKFVVNFTRSLRVEPGSMESMAWPDTNLGN